jgi:hypothetical protein
MELLTDSEIDARWAQACANFVREAQASYAQPDHTPVCACNNYPVERSPSCRVHPARLTRDIVRNATALMPRCGRQVGSKQL